MTDPHLLASPPVDSHGSLVVYRLWHPGHGVDSPHAFRTFGPLFRFDLHPEARPPDHQPDSPPAWYGGEAFETAVREVLDRDRPGRRGRIVQVCVRQRMAALALHGSTSLIDLTDPTVTGAPDDLGDRPDIDYRDTRRWARALHREVSSDGLRYHSARHRAVDGTRAGINVCLWSPDRPPRVVSDVNAAASGAWRRIQGLLTRIGAAPIRVHGCRRCSAG